LAFVGRLSPRKGPDVAIDVLAELHRRGVPATLVLAGSVFPGYEPFERELHERVRRAGLAEHVTFLGFVDDVWGVVHDCDVALVPSVLDEPFGNTAVEAVLAARPVVASATSGLREATRGYRTAITVPPGDVPAWADAVQAVVRDWSRVSQEVLADAAEAARRHAPDHFRARVADLTTFIPRGAR
jgi:glycosyltransferase involved in cell wall biosynthesis